MADKKKYVDADILKELFRDYERTTVYAAIGFLCEDIECIIDEAPAADVVPRSGNRVN